MTPKRLIKDFKKASKDSKKASKDSKKAPKGLRKCSKKTLKRLHFEPIPEKFGIFKNILEKVLEKFLNTSFPQGCPNCQLVSQSNNQTQYHICSSNLPTLSNTLHKNISHKSPKKKTPQGRPYISMCLVSPPTFP